MGTYVQTQYKKRRIQAYDPEGSKQEVLLEALLTGEAINKTIPGTTNAYKNYESQVRQIYRKYNGRTDFGTQQTRAIIDLRTAFIAGEGINVSAGDDKTAEWIEKFITFNKLNSSNLVNMVKGSEMAGQSLLILKGKEINNETGVLLRRIPYSCDNPYEPSYADDLFRDEVKDILVGKGANKKSIGFKNFIYIRTGGDDCNFWGPTTRTGIVLTDIENYDRAVKDQRRLNHILARITPVFKTQSSDGVQDLRNQLADQKWKIGEAYIGSAEFEYKTPGTSAHEILNSELVATIKTISSVTGIPVHWLGYVDLMSNRSTAETLYEMLKNGTSNERVIWEDSLYETILKAQEVYIDSGGTDLKKIDPEFQVKLPLLDFSNFLERIRAYSLAYNDGAISMSDYRNGVPGIDPLKTEKAIEEEKKKEEDEIMREAANFNFEQESQNDERNNLQEQGDNGGRPAGNAGARTA